MEATRSVHPSLVRFHQTVEETFRKYGPSLSWVIEALKQPSFTISPFLESMAPGITVNSQNPTMQSVFLGSYAEFKERVQQISLKLKESSTQDAKIIQQVERVTEVFTTYILPLFQSLENSYQYYQNQHLPQLFLNLSISSSSPSNVTSTQAVSVALFTVAMQAVLNPNLLPALGQFQQDITELSDFVRENSESL